MTIKLNANTKSIRKVLTIILSALILITITAYATYRYTMDNINISISDDTARLTVYGQSDDYNYTDVDMNPMHGNNKAINAAVINH